MREPHFPIPDAVEVSRRGAPSGFSSCKVDVFGGAPGAEARGTSRDFRTIGETPIGGFRPLFIERHSLGDSRDSHLSPSDLPNVILGDGSNIGAAFGRKCTVALPPRRDVNIGKEKPIQIPSRRTNTAHLPINTFYSVRVLYTNSW
jgi:hypothetical protein